MSTKWLDDEEDRLYNALNAGEITAAEYHRQIRGLRRDYQQAAEECARASYDREMERWR